MKTLWIKILLKLAFLLEPTKETCDWTKEDEKEWQKFFATPSGKKLMAYMEDLAQDNFKWAVTKSEQLDHASGWALGFSSAVALTKTLSYSTPQQPQESKQPKIDKHFDWLNP